MPILQLFEVDDDDAADAEVGDDDDDMDEDIDLFFKFANKFLSFIF
jgi:hypothetical protein